MRRHSALPGKVVVAGTIAALLAGCGEVRTGTAVESPGAGASVTAEVESPAPGSNVTTEEQPRPGVPEAPIGDQWFTHTKWRSERAAAACSRMPARPLPPDAGAPERAYRCSLEFRVVRGDGEWEFEVVRELTGGLDRLLAEYREPDASRTDGPCTLELPNPRIVWLHGRDVVAVRAPVDECGTPTRGAVAAYDSLTTRVVSQKRVRQVTSELAVSSGCSQDHKNMLFIEAEDGPPSTGARRQPLGAERHRVCTYVVTADRHGGRLVAARLLSPAEVAKVSAALLQSQPDATCDPGQHRRFALLTSPDESVEATYVALDGCAVNQGSGWWRGTDQLRALLR